MIKPTPAQAEMIKAFVNKVQQENKQYKGDVVESIKSLQEKLKKQ